MLIHAFAILYSNEPLIDIACQYGVRRAPKACRRSMQRLPTHGRLMLSGLQTAAEMVESIIGHEMERIGRSTGMHG